MLKIIPLGGLGEIGLNMMVFEYHDSAFIIDAGLMFPEDYMLGIDYVIPDMSYLKQIKSKISGIVLTHAHEDHIGALPFLLKDVNVPIFGTAFTLGVVRNKLEKQPFFSPALLHEIFPGGKLHLNPFELEFIRVCHSAVDGVGIAIKTPLGLVVHTGDFKIGHSSVHGMITDVNKFARCGDQGVLALLSDSTNVEKEGYTISDQEVGETLAKICSGRKGRIIVGLFASNITRIQQVIDIARAMDRKVIFNGRSIETTVNIAKALGYLNISEELEIDVQQLNDFPDNKIVIITTGSQGEPMAALARIAADAHKQVKIKEEDTVIFSSKFIPGNEKAITKIINNLYRRGADVIYEKISEIHVSGHAFQEELKLMIDLTRPKYFIPIHGEYRHLILHARLAEQVGIPKENILVVENGQVIGFGENGGSIQENVLTGRVFIDGKGIGDVGRSVLKERRNLSEDGIVVVNMVFDEETGVVLYGPEIVSHGFVFETETGHLLEDAKCIILEIVDEIGPVVPDRLNKIRSKMQTDLRKFFSFTIRRRPVILLFILEV
ncbi:MAG: ribonuclease J [Deltaproteobacteria bacterium]|nr:ribonuclease J [Deltaproteobacteria bacterium]MBW2013588.1 ribonuclease J [Deltaproteobacteria bacterium]MBW2089496.1 ribonuclease J [Deltaproteobacteria bacterium]MBW2320780.1 ribonuclease J [Deltaproteobacteria bacterium]